MRLLFWQFFLGGMGDCYKLSARFPGNSFPRWLATSAPEQSLLTRISELETYNRRTGDCGGYLLRTDFQDKIHLFFPQPANGELSIIVYTYLHGSMLDLSLSLLLLSLSMSLFFSLCSVHILSACASRLMGVTVENPAMGPSGVGIPGRSIVSKRSGSCGCSMRRRSSFAGAARGKNPVRHGGKPWKTPVG